MGPLLDEAAVRHIAQLSRLNVTDAELVRYAEQLSEILNYFRQLNELDTTDVAPTAHAVAVSNVFREDAIQEPWTPEKALANAPQTQAGFFKLPKVLDQESA